MKLEVMNVAEARKLVDKSKTSEKIMENINAEITQRASLGDTNLLIYPSFEMYDVGFRDLGKDNLEAVFRPIIDALREAGYTVEVGAGHSDEGFADVTIYW